jgi:uroporphyrin-III C-methyltransferase
MTAATRTAPIEMNAIKTASIGTVATQPTAPGPIAAGSTAIGQTATGPITIEPLTSPGPTETETSIAQGTLSSRANPTDRLALLEQLTGLPVPRLAPGHVWLVGAGPGDPGQLTLAAVAALAQADALVHDDLIDPAILAMAPGAARFFAGKRGGRPSSAQEDITAQLIALAQAGRRVVRLKGGDPYVFGRGGEEALALAEAGIPFRVIPGVTAGLASLASAAIPATMRGINHAVVLATGHGAAEAGGLDWNALARLNQPIIFYMALRRLDDIASALLSAGMAPGTPAAAVESGTLPGQRVVVATLATLVVRIQEAKIVSPAIIVIGGVVAVRERLLALIEGVC